MSPEYLFHSASTEADGSSAAGRCPKILLKKLLDMLAQYVTSHEHTPNEAGSISTPIWKMTYGLYFATSSMPDGDLSRAILQSTMHSFPEILTTQWCNASPTAPKSRYLVEGRLTPCSPPCSIEALSTLMELPDQASAVPGRPRCDARTQKISVDTAVWDRALKQHY